MCVEECSGTQCGLTKFSNVVLEVWTEAATDWSAEVSFLLATLLASYFADRMDALHDFNKLYLMYCTPHVNVCTYDTYIYFF